MVGLGGHRAGRYEQWGEIVVDPRAYRMARTADWASGAAMLVSADCLRSVGEWDESFFLYSEETDFGLRARDVGFATRYVPTASATHLEGGSAGSARLWPLLVANQVRLYGRRHGRPATAVFWAACLTREVSRSVLGRKSSQNAVRALLSLRRMRATPGPEWLR